MILSVLYFALMVVLLFGVTIFVHELGHYLVARWCGMVVDVFSIGFGPAIWKKKHNGITYKIGCIPFGGYVALPQMEPGSGQKKDDEKDAGEKAEERVFPAVAPWKKILVALAGATGNIILAVIISYIVYWGGKSYAPVENECIIGYVETNSVAYAQGLRMGDVIREVNGKSVGNWDSFILSTALQDDLLLTVAKTDGQTVQMPITTEEFMGGQMIRGIAPVNYCYILEIRPGSSAEESDLRPKDKIVEFNGIKLYSREQFTELVNQASGQQVPIKIERKDQTVEMQVTPRYDEEAKRALIGIVFNTFDVKKPWAQIKAHSMLIVRLLRALVTPKEARNAAGAVGGPVAIFQMFWLYVQTGLIMALWFTGLLNVNLAILNLLPIPVLDGGHIMFSLWEWITGRPVHEKIVEWLVNIFATLLIVLFLFLTYRDVTRWGAFRAMSKAVAEQPVSAETNHVPPVETTPAK